MSCQVLPSQLTFNCQLCGQYLCCATETICNHFFCEQCLHDYLLYLNQCPHCHTNLRNQINYSNKILDSLIMDHIQAEDSCQLKRFQLRLQKHKAFKRSTKFQRHKIYTGLPLDIRDAKHIWCTGKVVKVLRINENDASIEQIEVKYDSSKRKERIELPSNRVAAKGSYTGRKEIPHYYRKKIVFEHNGQRMEVVEWEPDSSTSDSRTTH